jgi:signal transduction histidine kinase
MAKVRDSVEALLSYKRAPKNSVKYAQLQLVDTLALMLIVVFILAALLFAYTKADVTMRASYLHQGIGVEIGEALKQEFDKALKPEALRQHDGYLALEAETRSANLQPIDGSENTPNVVPGYVTHFVYPIESNLVEVASLEEGTASLDGLCEKESFVDALKELLDTRAKYFNPTAKRPFVGNFRIKPICPGYAAIHRLLRVDQIEYIEGFVIDETQFFSSIVYQGLGGSMLSKFVWVSVFEQDRCIGSAASLKDVGSDVDVLVPEGAHQCPSGLNRVSRIQQIALEDMLKGYELHVHFYQSPRYAGLRVAQWLGVALVFTLLVTIYYVYQAGTSQIKIARERQEFLSSVAHELKTPLTSIRMHSELLGDGLLDASPAERKASYDYIHQESERLSRLIENVLRVARLGSTRYGKQLVVRAPEDILNLASSRVEAAVEAAGYRLVKIGDSEEIERTIRVEEDAIIAIFVNLVDNAIKFSKGGDRAQIDIGYRDSDGQGKKIVFFVRDYGSGIPFEEQSKIFDLFYRGGAKSTLGAAGTGIGLALVKEMAEGMSANVECEDLDPGAEFRVIFPCN